MTRMFVITDDLGFYGTFMGDKFMVADEIRCWFDCAAAKDLAPVVERLAVLIERNAERGLPVEAWDALNILRLSFDPYDEDRSESECDAHVPDAEQVKP